MRRGSPAMSRHSASSISTGSSDDSRSRAISGTSASRRRQAGRASACPANRRPTRSDRRRSAPARHSPAATRRARPAHLAHRHRAAGPAPERNDAEGAAVVAALLHLDEGARAALEPVDQRRRTLAQRREIADRDARAAIARGSSFSRLPRTRSTSAIAAKRSGWISAAQPVTMTWAPGCSRRARRIAWRAWRSASAVTAQVLTMTASVEPGRGAARRIASDSKAFRRQPKVTISTAHHAASGDERGIERAGEAHRRRPGHRSTCRPRASR